MAAEIQFTSEYMIVMCLGHHIIMMVQTFLVNNDMLLCKPEDNEKGAKIWKAGQYKTCIHKQKDIIRLLSNWESQVFFLLISKHIVSQNKENRIIAKEGKRNERRNKYSQDGSQNFPEGMACKIYARV